MKTSSILLVAGFVLLPFCLTPLFCQQQNDNNNIEKRITIIKHSIDADGAEVTETIVKKGKAAENFDVDKYVRENQDANNQVEVTVNDIKEEHHNHVFGWTSSCDDNSAFLGVEEDSDEDADQPGLIVQIVRGSGAEKAGLRDNDKILQLNDTKTDKWSDLSTFVSNAKPGDKVKITYSRNGKNEVAEATLSTRKELKCDAKMEPKGFLGVSDEGENEVAGSVAVSITKGSGAEKAGLVDGDVIYKLNDTPIADFEDITDFMAYTKPGEKIMVAYDRDGQHKSVEAILGEQKNALTNDNIFVRIPDFDMKGLREMKPDELKAIKLDEFKELKEMKELKMDLKIPSNLNYAVKQKEACLGVYSNENEAQGATIQSFTTESAAREVGMVEGDQILSVNGQKVNGHSELWDEIAKYKTGDKVDVAYERDGKSLQVQATLKACRDNQSRVEILNQTENGIDQNRRFYTWNWNNDDQRTLRETRIIIIRRAGEGDGTKVDLKPASNPPVQDRSLTLESFKAFPNPSSGQVTVEFKGEPVATVVSLLDVTGRQLFREELNAFNGEYNQQFDLTAYAKGTIVIHVQQGDKVFTEQIIVN